MLASLHLCVYFVLGIHPTCLSASAFFIVISPPPSKLPSAQAAFSLIEMVAVIAILVALMTAGVSLLNGTGSQSRKAGTDMLSGLIEQARTTAITSRSYVVLAIAEPGDLPSGDERCRLGLFKVDEEWSDASKTPSPLKCTLLSRWQTLHTGIVLIPDALTSTEITLAYGGSKNLSVKVHAIAFNSRGGLHYPAGSTPITVRIAEGGYRGSPPIATPNKRGPDKKISENRLKIGRVTARPYRID